MRASVPRPGAGGISIQGHIVGCVARAADPTATIADGISMEPHNGTQAAAPPDTSAILLMTSARSPPARPKGGRGPTVARSALAQPDLEKARRPQIDPQQ